MKSVQKLGDGQLLCESCLRELGFEEVADRIDGWLWDECSQCRTKLIDEVASLNMEHEKVDWDTATSMAAMQLETEGECNVVFPCKSCGNPIYTTVSSLEELHNAQQVPCIACCEGIEVDDWAAIG